MKLKPMFAASAVILALFGGPAAPSSAFAASQDECAIWICAAGGFPAACSAAKSAMFKRIKKLKPPLPPWSACAIEDETQSNMSSDYGHAAHFPAEIGCRKKGDGLCRVSNRVELKEKYIDGTSCWWYRRELTYEQHMEYDRTCKDVRYIKVFLDGSQYGETYYWEK